MRWCRVCGEKYADDEIRIDADCPNCGAAESLIQLCDECDARLPDDGGICGLCPNCVKERINYKNGCEGDRQ